MTDNLAVVNEQTAIPFTGTVGEQLLTQSLAVTGGVLHSTVLRSAGPGNTGRAIALAQTFVPSAQAGGLRRNLKLVDAKSDLGVPLTVVAGTPTGAPAITRVAGTSFVLTGEATSGAAAKTDKAIFDVSLPDSYVAGSDIAVKVNCNTSGTVITAGSTTMTVAAYTETNGVEAALTVSAAQQIPATATDLTFTITGTGLVPGQRLVLELVMLVTTASGAGTGLINAVSFVA